MRRLIFTLLSVALATSFSQAGSIIISEVLDGNRIAADGSAGSSPDPFLAFVELTNAGSAATSLGGLHYHNFNNGGTTQGNASSPLSGTLAPGETYYIAYESAPTAPAVSAFETTYGFAPNEFAGGKFYNGDDVIVLLNAPHATGALDTTTVVDVFGVLGTDGTGEPWEYTDTVASRNASVTSCTSTFDITEWTVQSTNLFDGEGAAFHASNSSVIQVPEPTALALLGLGVVFAIGIRRKR